MVTTGFLEQVLVWIGRISWHASVLVLLVLVVQRIFQTRLAPRWRYALWWLVLLRLLLPAVPATPFSIFNVVRGRAQTPRPALIPEIPSSTERSSGLSQPLVLPTTPPEALSAGTPVIADEAVPVTPPDASPSLAPTAPESVLPRVLWGLAGAWAAGMGLLLGRVLWGNLSFARCLRRRRPLADPAALQLLDECRRLVGVSQPRAVIETPEVDGPALFGCFRVVLLLPPGLTGTFSRAELRHVFLHELAHLRRWDVPTNWLMTLLQIAHWFNPLIWLASARMRADRELACDALALSLIRDEERRPYGQTIIKFLEGFVHPAAVPGLVGILEEKAQMKRRIHMIVRFKQTSHWPILAVALFLGLGLITLTDARDTPPREDPSAGGTTATDKVPENPASPSASADDDIVDPNTGVKFVLAKTFSGANNVIKFTNKLWLSPDARFLIGGGFVVPVDGTGVYPWTEQRGDMRDRAVSPNGRYIAHGEKAVWLQPVSPETLRPDGPAKKLVDLGEGRLTGRNNGRSLHWTRDSETIFFAAYTSEGGVRQYAFSAETGVPVSYPDAASAGLPSPDGKCIALTPTDPTGGYWVKPIGDGAARLLGTRPPGEPRPPMCWSKDGHWLIGDQLNVNNGVVRFLRYPEGQEYLVSLPKELVKRQSDYVSTCCVGPSADGSKLFFYQTAYATEWRVKVASADGAPLRNVDSDVRYAFRAFQWTRDGKATFQTDYMVYGGMQGETDLLMSPVSGEKPIPFTLRPAVPVRSTPLAVSPDSKWLLFTAPQESGSSTLNLNVIPLSMADHGVSGPATAVFRVASPARGGLAAPVWSPDSTRAALTCKADPADEQDVWVVFADGRTPIRLTRTAAIERDLQWSPDGNKLAFVADDGGAAELKVVPSAGGEAVVLRQWSGAEAPSWGWSPDGKSLTIAEQGRLARQPVSGRKTEPIVDLQEHGIGAVTWLGYSSDGSRLALAHRTEDTNDPLSPWGQLLFAHVEGSRLQKAATVKLDGGNYFYAWSPDNTHVAYLCEDTVPVRPEGRLYAVAVDDVVERIEAGAIPPSGPEAGEPVATEAPSESQSTPQPEPITGPVFSDNFDKGLSKCWQIVDWNAKGSPPPAHAVENGQLMLSNSSARLSQIDWADYLVTVRVCLKEGGAPVSIETRATPSNSGINNMDRYSFAFTRPRNAPASSARIGLQYHNPSGGRGYAGLCVNPCPLVPDKWYKLAFEVRGEHLRGYLDDKLLMEATDARLSNGAVWITAAGSPVLFDDFSVRRLPRNAE